MTDDTYNQFRLEEYKTRREGMVAENAQRLYLGQSPAFMEDCFNALADEIRNFAEINR
jgi:hypothetical protein